MSTKAGRENSRKRAPNWTHNEMRLMLDEIYNEREIIQKKCSMEITNRKKREAWVKIQTRVNACGVGHRTVLNIKDKWGQMRDSVLKKDKYGGGTGGGREHKPVPFEDVINKIIGDNTALKEGIQGIGTDSFAAGQQEGNTSADIFKTGDVQSTNYELCGTPAGFATPLPWTAIPVATATSSADVTVLTGILTDGDLSLLHTPPSVSTPLHPIHVQTVEDSTVSSFTATGGDLSGMNRPTSPVVTDMILSDDHSLPASAHHQQTTSSASQLQEQQQQQSSSRGPHSAKTWRNFQLKKKRNQRKRLSCCDEDDVCTEFMRSEIAKNKLKAELIKTQIEKNKTETELAQLKIAKLQKEMDFAVILEQ